MEKVHLESEFRSQPPLVQLQEQHLERPREDSRIGEEEMRKFTQQVHALTTDKLDEFYLRCKYRTKEGFD